MTTTNPPKLTIPWIIRSSKSRENHSGWTCQPINEKPTPDSKPNPKFPILMISNLIKASPNNNTIKAMNKIPAHKVFKASIKIMTKTSKATSQLSIAKISQTVNFPFFKAVNLNTEISIFKSVVCKSVSWKLAKKDKTQWFLSIRSSKRFKQTQKRIWKNKQDHYSERPNIEQVRFSVS